MAINPVVIDFQLRNVDNVQRALRSISDTVLQTERRASSTTQSESTIRKRLAEREAREKVAAFRRADAMVTAAQRAGLREAERAFKAEARAAEKSANDRIRIEQRVANEARRLRAEVASQSIQSTAAKSGLKLPSNAAARLSILDKVKGASPADQRAALDKVKDLHAEDKVAQRAAKEKVAAWKSADREIQKAKDQGAKFAEKRAREELREFEAAEREKNAVALKWVKQRESEQRRADNEAAARRRQFASNVVGAGGSALKKSAGIVAGAATAIGYGVSQLGGGISPIDAIQQRLALRGQLADISNRAIIKGDTSADQLGRRRSVDELQKQVSDVGIKYAIDPSKATAGLDKFASKTGNIERGTQLLGGLAEMSRAGAGDLDDLADAAGDVFNADTSQNAEQVLTVMRALSAQGKIGAVEMKDLANQMARLGASAGKFQGDAGKNMAMMGGLAQLARASGGAESAPAATTAVQSLTNQFYKNARIKGFAELGVQTKDEKTGFNRDLDKVLIETMLGAEKKSRAGGHGMRDFDVIIGKAVADSKARQALNPLANEFKKAGGGEAGAKAVQDLLTKYTGATQSKEDVTEAAKERMKETDVQLEIQFQKLRASIADHLLPSFIALVPKIELLIPPIGSLIDGVVRAAAFFEKNPFEGFAALVTGFFLKELAAAQIADTIKKILSGAGGGGVPGGGAAGGAGGAAAGGLIALGGAVQVEGLSSLADQTYGAMSSGKDAAKAIAGDLNSGDAGKINAAHEAIQDAQEKSSGARVASAWMDRALTAAKYAINPISAVGQAAGDAATEKLGMQSTSQRSVETLKANEIVNAPELQKVVTQAISEGVREGVKQGSGGGVGPNPSNRTGSPVVSPKRGGPS